MRAKHLRKEEAPELVRFKGKTDRDYSRTGRIFSDKTLIFESEDSTTFIYLSINDVKRYVSDTVPELVKLIRK